MNKNLLIIGAGGHGKVVSEIAEDLGYHTAFLDDSSADAIGTISDMEKFLSRYEYAFVGIGNNHFRGELTKRLEDCGYIVPVLLHPTAYVSRTAVIEKGTVVEPKAIVNANTHIGVSCIVSVGAIVDHDVSIGNCVHVNAGAIVKAGADIEAYRKLEAGEVVLGYGSARVNKK